MIEHVLKNLFNSMFFFFKSYPEWVEMYSEFTVWNAVRKAFCRKHRGNRWKVVNVCLRCYKCGAFLESRSSGSSIIRREIWKVSEGKTYNAMYKWSQDCERKLQVRPVDIHCESNFCEIMKNVAQTSTEQCQPDLPKCTQSPSFFHRAPQHSLAMNTQH